MSMRLCCTLLGFWIVCCQPSAAEPVSLKSLLAEMTDRASLARWPDPAYTCKQASSYDRASTAKDAPGWFANNDRSFFIREENIEQTPV